MLFERYIDDMFGVFEGTWEDVSKFIKEYNNLVPSIIAETTSGGCHAIFMDLVIWKGDRFYEQQLLDIRVYQKELNIYSYIPFNSKHAKHVFKNFVLQEIDRYIKFNSDEFHFWKIIKKFFKRCRNRGYPRKFLMELFQKIDYRNRNFLLGLFPVSQDLGKEMDELTGDWNFLPQKGKKSVSKTEKMVFKVIANDALQNIKIGSIFKSVFDQFKASNYLFGKCFQNYEAIICNVNQKNLLKHLCRSKLLVKT